MKISAKDRFLKNVKLTQSCWIWSASKNNSGYGQFWYEQKMQTAHRVSYKLFISEIPKGKCVLHRCDNPGCVNPKHLWLGSQLDNIQDRFEKGRSSSGENHTSKHTLQDVNQIRDLYNRGIYTIKTLAEKYMVSVSNISKIINNQIWRSNIIKKS